MTDYFIGVARGSAGMAPVDFIVGTATSGATDLEVKILGAAAWKKSEVAYMLQRIIDHLLDSSANVEGVANGMQ